MRKYCKIIIAISIAVSVFVLGACSAQSPVLTFEDDVVARYNDGILIRDQFRAPQHAIEYTDVPRVNQTMQIDNRVGGLHFTGLYLPAGESVRVTLGMGKLSKHKIVLFPERGAQRKELLISQQSVVFTAPEGEGGELYLEIERGAGALDSFELSLDGAARAPFYRLGADRVADLADKTGRAVLESGNLRISLPQSQVPDKGVEEALRWWRSAVELLDEFTGTGSNADDHTKINVYVTDGNAEAQYHRDIDFITIGAQRLDGVLDYDTLCSEGGNGLLQAAAAYKTARSEGFENAIFADDAVTAALALAVNLELRDRAVEWTDGKPSSDAEKFLIRTLEGRYPSEEKLAFFIGNLSYSLGKEAITEAVKYYRYALEKEKEGCENTLLVGLSQAIGWNLAQYGALFGIQLSDEEKTQIARYPLFIPVQTSLTSGGSDATHWTGAHILLGNVTEFDFNDSVTALGTQWRVEDLVGTPQRWTKRSEGVYEYNPSPDLLRDRYSVTLSDGVHSVTLHGNITVDIRTVQCDYYEDVQFRTIEDAINGYKALTPSVSEAYSIAQTPDFTPSENDVAEGTYTLAVMHGGLQVPESGKYRFYLASKGLCRVDFGVSKYHFTMLGNVLTVDAFTDELSYEMTLEAGKVYYFNVYVLNTANAERATLGIRKEGEAKAAPIGTDYLVYGGLERDQLQIYHAPEVPISDYEVQHSVYDAYDMRSWKIQASQSAAEDCGAELILDGNRNSAYQSLNAREEFVFDVDLKEGHAFEYFTLGVGVETLGAFMTLEASDDGHTYRTVLREQLHETDNVYRLEQSSGAAAHLRVTLRKDNAFICRVTHLFIGKLLSEAVIVPNTSTKLEYQGEWEENRSFVSVNGVVTQNKEKNCAVTYRFFGKELSIYATKGPQFGQARIFVDNKEVARVDLKDRNVVCGQQIFYRALQEGLHTVKIMPIDDSLINLDYFAIVPTEEFVEKGDTSKLWVLAIIPVIALIGLSIALTADHIDKKKREKKRVEKKSPDASDAA